MDHTQGLFIGVNSLPKKSPVEIDGIFAIHEKIQKK